MAQPQEEVPGAGAPNRTLVAVMGAIALAFIIGGLVVGGKKKKSSEPPLPPGNARALVVPTDEASRTVIVAPCGTDVEKTARDARQGESTPNTVRFALPRNGGDRAVLVPDCSPKSGVSGSVTGLPAAAFVLPVGTRENRLQVPPLRAESQLLVPKGSDAKTVVVSPCTGQLGGEAGKPVPSREGGTNQDAVLQPEDGQGTVATAPQC